MLKSMMRLAGLALAAAGAPAAATQTEPIQPARWHLDGATSRCVLTRQLAGSPVPATFILRSIPGSGRYEIIFASPDFPDELLRLRNRPSVHLSLEPAGTVEAPAGRIELPGSLGDGISIGPLPAELIPVFGRAATLGLSADEGRPLASWSLPAAARAAEAFSSCESEKLREWGADPAAFEAGATAAIPAADSESWLTPRELGLQDALASIDYTAFFRLTVDANGRVSDCALLESAGNVDLSRGCLILRRVARFTPATDAAGHPIQSVVIHVADVRVRIDIRIIEG